MLSGLPFGTTTGLSGKERGKNWITILELSE